MRAVKNAEQSHVWEKPFWSKKKNAGRCQIHGQCPKPFNTFRTFIGKSLGTIQQDIICFEMRRRDKVCFATRHLTKNSREEQIHSKCCAFVFLANPQIELQIGKQPQKTFYTTDGCRIDWNPIAVERTPTTQLLERLQRMLQKVEDQRQLLNEYLGGKRRFQQEELKKCEPSQPKDWKKLQDLQILGLAKSHIKQSIK